MLLIPHQVAKEVGRKEQTCFTRPGTHTACRRHRGRAHGGCGCSPWYTTLGITPHRTPTTLQRHCQRYAQHLPTTSVMFWCVWPKWPAYIISRRPRPCPILPRTYSLAAPAGSSQPRRRPAPCFWRVKIC